MPKPYSIDLRERVVGYVDAGHSRHAAAAHFRVSVSFVVILMRNYRKTESLAPRPVAVAAIPSSTRIVGFCLAEKDDITMSELAAELATAAGVQVAAASISRWLIRNGYRFKKNAAGQRARSS
jgi:transposase